MHYETDWNITFNSTTYDHRASEHKQNSAQTLMGTSIMWYIALFAYNYLLVNSLY